MPSLQRTHIERTNMMWSMKGAARAKVPHMTRCESASKLANTPCRFFARSTSINAKTSLPSKNCNSSTPNASMLSMSVSLISAKLPTLRHGTSCDDLECSTIEVADRTSPFGDTYMTRFPIACKRSHCRFISVDLPLNIGPAINVNMPTNFGFRLFANVKGGYRRDKHNNGFELSSQKINHICSYGVNKSFGLVCIK